MSKFFFFVLVCLRDPSLIHVEANTLLIACESVRREMTSRASWGSLAWLLMAWLILASHAVESWGPHARLVYSGLELLQLRGSSVIVPSDPLLSCVPQELLKPPELNHHAGRPRRRGRRGGVRRRMRGAAKLPLPSVLLCNARSLKRKMDELRALAKMPTPSEPQTRSLTVFTDIYRISQMQHCW